MRPVKDAAIKETVALRKRIRRSLALERIGRSDADYIVQRLDEIEARIIVMPTYGEEEDNG